MLKSIGCRRFVISIGPIDLLEKWRRVTGSDVEGTYGLDGT
jgi:hypothetical protein